MSDYRIIRELDEHPIPTDEEDIADLWENHDSPGEPPHPDVAHDEYVNTIAEHGVWHVFRTHYPFESRGIVFWNRAFGSGFTIDDSEGQWHHMVNLFAEIVSQEGDCRDAETSDSLMQCSGYRQRCKNCGDSWTVG